MEVTKMMGLYTIVVILVLSWRCLSQEHEFTWANSGFTQLPEEVDNGNLNTNLTKIDLSGNQLTIFDSNLTCCTQVSTLDLSNNRLSDVVITRKRNIVITILNLSNNNLKSSPRISSEVANTLEEVYLDDNALTSMKPELLSSLSKLNIISLGRNTFSVLPDFSASGNTLTFIDLQGNLITDCTSIRTIPSLIILDLKQNSLQMFPKARDSVSIVTSLNLYENGINVVPDEDLIVFIALEYLDIARNSLSQFPNISLVGKTLTDLYLWGNAISSIDSTNFNGVQGLKYLSLAGNGLRDFPDMGPTVGKTLKTLDLNHNSLGDSVIDIFYNLVALTQLDLTANTLTKVPNISTSDSISLLLANNNIDSAGLSFLSGKNISHLDLSYNNIITLSGLTGLETTLRVLNLKGNPITSLSPGAFTGYIHLRTLNLASTLLSSIPDLTDLQGLLTLKLKDVPLVCNCSALWLTLWTTSAGSGRLLTMSTTPCHQPQSLVNVLWADVQLDCPDLVSTPMDKSTSEDTNSVTTEEDTHALHISKTIQTTPSQTPTTQGMQNTPSQTATTQDMQNTPSQTATTQDTPDTTSQTATTQDTQDTTSQTATTQDMQNTPSQTATTQDIPDTTSQTATTQDIPDTTSQTATTQDTPDTTSQTATTQDTPDTTSQTATTQDTPDTTSQTATTQDTPDTTSQTATTQDTPDTTSQTATTQDNPDTTSQTATTQDNPDTISHAAPTLDSPDTTSQTATTQDNPDTTSQTATTQDNPDTTSQTATTQDNPDTTSQTATTQDTPDTTSQTATTQDTPDTTSLTTKTDDSSHTTSEPSSSITQQSTTSSAGPSTSPMGPVSMVTEDLEVPGDDPKEAPYAVVVGSIVWIFVVLEMAFFLILDLETYLKECRRIARRMKPKTIRRKTPIAWAPNQGKPPKYTNGHP